MDSEHSRAGDRESQIVQASRWIKDAERIVVLTGAGISTDSGIPDFRGPKGLWTRNPEAEKMATLEHYMNDADVRRRAWQGRMDTGIEALRPNAGHLALVDLERVGNLDTLITQNVDGLHHEAGSDPDHIVEIHGTIREVVCMKCGERGPMHQTLERVEAGEVDPPCKGCGGILKSATISFGQGLVDDDLERSQDAAMRCDLVLAVGTTLAVYPIANVVPIAKQAGARVIIVNGGPTEMDELADTLLRGSISEILPRLVAANA